MSNATSFAFDWQGVACGTNKRYVNRTFNLTPEYEDFMASIAETCWAMNPGVHLEGRISLKIHLRIDPARDSDSLLKPIFDGIEKSGVIKDDRQFRGRYTVDPVDKAPGELDEVVVIGTLIDAP